MKVKKKKKPQTKEKTNPHHIQNDKANGCSTSVREAAAPPAGPQGPSVCSEPTTPSPPLGHPPQPDVKPREPHKTLFKLKSRQHT